MKSNKINYVILGTQRTGTTYICDILHHLGLMKDNNLNFEVFHRENLAKYEGQKNIKIIENLNKEYSIKKFCGYKILYSDLENIERRFKTKKNRILGYLPNNTKFILIRRRNKLRQSISHCLALKRRKWINTTGEKEAEIKINDDYIDYQLRTLMHDDTQLKKLLLKTKRPIMEIYYEDFEKDAKNTIKEILNFIETKVPKLKIKSKLKKQADGYTEEIVQNYKGILTKNKINQIWFFYSFYFIKRIYRTSGNLRLHSKLYGNLLDSLKKIIRLE